MRKCALLAVAILGVALLWGSEAKAQCSNGQCVQFVPSSVVVSNGIGFAPSPGFAIQSFGSVSHVVPTNGIFFSQGLGRNVIIANRGIGRNVVVVRNGLFGRTTTVISR